MELVLQCGHRLNDLDNRYLEWYGCPECKMSVRVMAFECREWKVTCGTHRYGRWYGQARSEAFRDKHFRCQFATCDYLVVEEKKQKVRKLYGRKVGLRIPDVVAPKRWPDMRTEPMWQYKANNPDLTGETVSLPVIDDIPPF